MRKLTLLLLLVALTLLAAFPATAQPLDELNALADQVPAETRLFVALRTDEAYIATLDGIVDQVSERLGMPLPNLSQSLDMAAMNIDPEGDFESVFRPWLGDTAAFAVYGVEAAIRGERREPIAMLLLSVTDQAAAEAYLDQTVELNTFQEWTKETLDDGSIAYIPEFGSGFLLADGVLYNGDFEDVQAFAEAVSFEASLASREDFGAAFNNLPLDDYNISLFGDVAGGLAPLGTLLNAEVAAGNPDLAGLEGIDFEALFSAFGPVTAGLTILDGTTFTADLHADITDMEALLSALEGLGVGMTDAMLMAGEPLDESLTARIPADALLVGQSSLPASAQLAQLQATIELGEMYDQMYADMSLPELVQDPNALSFALLDDVTVFFQLAAEGLSGLSLEELVGWQDGDNATYVMLLPQDLDAFIDIGFITQTSDMDGAQRYLDATPRILTQLNIPFTQEEDRYVLSFVRDIVTAFLPDGDSENLDILIGAENGVYAAGSRLGAAFALSGEEGLTATDAYQSAAQYFLPDSQMLFYVAVPPLVDFLNTASDILGEGEGAQELAQATAIAQLFSNATITGVTTDGSDSTVRLTITLAE